MHIPPQALKLASSSMLGEWHQSSLIVLGWRWRKSRLANGPVLEPGDEAHEISVLGLLLGVVIAIVGFKCGEALIKRLEVCVVRIKALAIGVQPLIHGGVVSVQGLVILV